MIFAQPPENEMQEPGGVALGMRIGSNENSCADVDAIFRIPTGSHKRRFGDFDDGVIDLTGEHWGLAFSSCEPKVACVTLACKRKDELRSSENLQMISAVLLGSREKK